MKFQIYQAADGFRWRALAQNKKIVADSGEAYATKASVRRAVRQFVKHVPKARLEEPEQGNHGSA